MVNKESLQFLQLLESSSSFPCFRLPALGSANGEIQRDTARQYLNNSKILTGQVQVSYKDHHDPAHVLLPVCPHPHASRPSENQRLILQDHWCHFLVKTFSRWKKSVYFFLVLHPLQPSVMASNYCATVLCFSESFIRVFVLPCRLYVLRWGICSRPFMQCLAQRCN